jgi:GT2 family glycosyltransferase
VDNASQDGSVAMVEEKFPEVHLIANTENLGFSRANNLALKKARGKYLLLLNSDTEVLPSALQHLIEALQATPTAGAAGPQMLNPDGSLQNCYGSLPTVFDELIGPYWLDFLNKPWGKFGGRLAKKQQQSKDCFSVDRVSFAGTLIRREMLEQVGYLDETYLFYSEDYDWFMRLKKAGWEAIFCPQAYISHHWGGSSRKNNEWALSQLYHSKRLYFAKHHGPFSEQILRFGLAARFALKGSIAALKQDTHTTKIQKRLLREMLTPLEAKMIL